MAMQKKMIVVHCADTYARMDIGAKEIREWHLAKGFADIGYAMVIRRNGDIEAGRDSDGDGDTLDEVGAHARGYNGESIGICLVGGRSDDDQPTFNFTAKQMDSLEFLLSELESKFPGIEILGHCDLPEVTKQCPCFDIKAWRSEC